MSKIASALNVVFLCTFASCTSGPPALTAVLPGQGYPRQLLGVDGDTQFASVVWNAGLADEVVLPGALFGSVYFQVPENATPGNHPVAIRNINGTSNVVQVNVLPYEDFRGDPTEMTRFYPAPRIEDIGVLAADGAGPVNIVLTVAAANLDVDASVEVEEVVRGASPTTKRVTGTTPWGGLPIDYLQSHKPSTFGYPVYHYGQLICVVENVTLGSEAKLQVTVKNRDGKTSTREFKLPDSSSAWDGDGDGLLDSWEDSVYTATSGRTISLANFGAHKWRKDILVEVDWIPDAEPPPAVWQSLQDTFRAAPVLNPDGSRGVNLIIDHGQGGFFANGGEKLPDHDCLTFALPAPAGSGSCSNLQSFYTYKQDHFDPDRLLIFHYAILGRKQATGNTGLGERHGNDFFVTLLGGSLDPTDLNLQLGTFMHELGHNLGFSHGDLKSDIQNYFLKHNLPSVMNYRYSPAGVDIDCNLSVDGVFTYSQGTLATLNENNVDEMLGICDRAPLEFDGVPGFTAGPMNLNRFEFDPATGAFDTDTTDQWDDFDQWGNMLLKFDTSDSQWNMN